MDTNIIKYNTNLLPTCADTRGKQHPKSLQKVGQDTSRPGDKSNEEPIVDGKISHL